MWCCVLHNYPLNLYFQTLHFVHLKYYRFAATYSPNLIIMSKNSKATSYVRENLSEEHQILICYIQEEFLRMKEEIKNDMVTLFGSKLKEVEDLKSLINKRLINWKV